MTRPAPPGACLSQCARSRLEGQRRIHDKCSCRPRHRHPLDQRIPCSIPPLQYDRCTRDSVMGGMNYHIEVSFDDGMKWIARIRRFNATSPPVALRDYIIKSEVATLKFLELTDLPSPRVYDFASENANNPVGVSHILMEKLLGKSLRWALATQKQKKNVMNQLADIFVELHKYPFDLLSSLDHPSDTHISALARESLNQPPGRRRFQASE